VLAREAICFSFASGQAVKEGLHRRLAVAPPSLMGPLRVVLRDNAIEIDLERLQADGEPLA
jgi:hypothetical protein